VSCLAPPTSNAHSRLFECHFLFGIVSLQQHYTTSSNFMADREQWQNLASASSTSSTPNSGDSLGDFLSPSRMNLPTRKRSHSKHLDGALGPAEDNKSRRTSPNPFMTGPGTPSTISSGYGYGYPLMLGDGYFDLTLLFVQLQYFL
jgi:hypothetical protein